MTRRATLKAVSDALADRAVVWSGLRGTDAESLGDLPQYDANVSVIDCYSRRPLSQSVSYEELSGRREDMEAWDVAEHLTEPPGQEFRRALLRATVAPCALIPYRASRFLSSIWFARQDRCLNLGMFGEAQRAFEHKPWVEWSVAQLGIPGLDWQYVADEEQLKVRDYLAEGPVMLRRSTSSGGSGFFLVTEARQLHDAWPRQEESFVGISRYLADTVSVNVGAVAWADAVTVHHASVQLIGVAECVTRRFGHCGNDFAAAKNLPASTLDLIEEYTVRVGKWLASHGYRGAFGVDYMVDDDMPRFTEVNPRFQGSTAASSRLSVEAELPCIVLEHVAAFLGLGSKPRPPLRVQVAEAEDLAQVIVHWTGGSDAQVDAASLGDALQRVDETVFEEVLVPPTIAIARGGTVGRFGVRHVVSNDGTTLPASWREAISRWNRLQNEASGVPN